MDIYLIIVVVLFVLAISDLVVGVSNDAVNFLNSAIGAKVASFKVIMIIAALGVLVGATFSSGMMEIARQGIFHPNNFYFNEIMIIFLAVMMTDIILLDLYNTFGLPTSTTVSIIFELLGASVAVALYKIIGSAGSIVEMGTYINTGKALAIIFGILLSVVIAFTFGSIVQYVARIFFSFNYNKSYRYFGSLYGGVAITGITFFMLIKGAKGSSFLTPESLDWIQHNTMNILMVSLLGWTILLQLLVWLFRINILKVIVLIGTFALAMAFAGNDLVNFIGVPLAGFASFQEFMASGAEPGALTMEVLLGPVQTPTLYLLIAGLVMVITLWFSKKARSVTKTSIDLSRQDEGEERFASSLFARAIVYRAVKVNNLIRTILPAPVLKKIESRFKPVKVMKKSTLPSFDLIRASVNLLVASILIAIGTNLKLPLSTTYVTFMVAMGTSFADGAWGRESAVFRITGVITVIGGWFFTALSAFTAAFAIATLIYYGGIVAIGIMIIIALFFLYKTHALHNKKGKEEQEKELQTNEEENLNGLNVFESCNSNVLATIIAVAKLYQVITTGLIHEKRKALKKLKPELKILNQETKDLKKNMHKTIRKLEDSSIESGHYYVQVLDYLRETVHSITFIHQPAFEHVDNAHPALIPVQVKDLTDLSIEISNLFNVVIQIISDQKFDDLSQVIAKQQFIFEMINKLKKKQVKMLKKEDVGTKTSLLFFELLNESKNLLLHTINLVKAERDFVIYNRENNLKK